MILLQKKVKSEAKFCHGNASPEHCKRDCKFCGKQEAKCHAMLCANKKKCNNKTLSSDKIAFLNQNTRAGPLERG